MKNKFGFYIFLIVITCCILALPIYLRSSRSKEFDFSGYNILFVSFDALQAAHTGCLGHGRNTTPTIDGFAKQGFLFTQCISTSSWTVPASMSWFTSLYPSEHKVLNKYSKYTETEKVLSDLKQLSPDVVTLTEILKANGYVAGAFTGDAGVSARFGFGNGFDSYLDDIKFSGLDHSIPSALQWLRDNKGKKFFMFLHGYDSHGQYDPPGGFTKRFLDFEYKGELKGGKEEQARFREEGLEKGFIELTDEDVRFWRALYDEKINDADRRFSQFIDELKALGLLEKTILILTSDHGTEFYEHKRFDHGFSLYEELIHVPLVIYLPGFSGGIVINDQVSGIDFMPTVLDFLKIKLNPKVKGQMRGMSLVPLLKGGHRNEDAFCETEYRLYTHKRAIRTHDGWKFILTLENNDKELYNLNTDPKERQNLIAIEPRRAYELEQKLLRWMILMGRKINLSDIRDIRIKEY